MNQVNAKRAIKQFFTRMSLNGGSNTVLLTFDDGPHPEFTPEVLQLLKKYNARAIFFVVGSRIQRAPHLLKRILDEGHALGNHSYSHPIEKQLWFGAYLKDLMRCQRFIKGLTDEGPEFFRPPLGRLSFASLVAPRILGLTTLLWSVDARDWGLKSAEEARATADCLAEKLLGKPSCNDIVLMHDDHPYVGRILESVLPQLARHNCDLFSALDTVKQSSTE